MRYRIYLLYVVRTNSEMSPPTPEDCRDGQQRRLRRALNFLCDRLTDDDEHSEINNFQRKENGINAVTFESIKSRIDGLQYGSTKDFLDDILSMQSKVKGSSIRLKKIANKMVEFCKNEITFIDACDSCYELANTNDSEWFQITCEKLHAPVWAKVIGYPYEPAKLLRIHDKIATVHFFGDHTISETQTKLCYRFSEESPNQGYLSDANVMQEVQAYIKNLGPSFEYAQFGQRLTTHVTPAITSTSISAQFRETSNVTPATTSTWSSTIRRNFTDLLDKNDEEFERLKTQFKLREAVYRSRYRSEIKELEEKLSAQKHQFDEDLREAKSNKYCDCCKSSTETAINIFCSNACGAQWYSEKSNVDGNH